MRTGCRSSLASARATPSACSSTSATTAAGCSLGALPRTFPCSQRQLEMGRGRCLTPSPIPAAFRCARRRRGHAPTSLDLSRRWLDWGKRNFLLNQIDPAGHDFVYGEAFDWLRRLAKKQRLFDVIVLDPPTFSQSKESGVFRAEKDYGRLVACGAGPAQKRRRAVRFYQRRGLAARQVPGRRGHRPSSRQNGLSSSATTSRSRRISPSHEPSRPI